MVTLLLQIWSIHVMNHLLGEKLLYSHLKVLGI